jgi:hypothetical protein
MSNRLLRAGTTLFLGETPVRLESTALVSNDTFTSDAAFAEHLTLAGQFDLHRSDLESEIERDGKRFFRSFGRNAEEVLTELTDPPAISEETPVSSEVAAAAESPAVANEEEEGAEAEAVEESTPAEPDEAPEGVVTTDDVEVQLGETTLERKRKTATKTRKAAAKKKG